MLELRYTWEPFLDYGQKLELKKNTVIYLQGESGKGFYYLSKGGVKILFLSDQGNERIINYVPVGMLLGEHGVHKENYLTTAVTTSPSVLYYFSDEDLSKVCADHPNAATIFTHSLIYKFRILAEIISLLDSGIEHQMAYYLLKLVHENGNISIDQTSFAQYIGTSRITVNKTFQKWKQQGLIEITGRKIQILDMKKMSEIGKVM
ncbi:Crp/Fnr family transcriptional regulator [Aneurinibacillus thermoaerophilus]|uniref:Crp/Fnr family transcriptional regulator n=1 Tax=Aneurinibacillus thermoaerophilus TaxID=143495 RepID=A0ABX8YEA5_ANETH|nr:MULTISPECIES: Crp/Fnr family transcriptional regulator [Aneurinibacillus]AMA73463.1 Crp/Fnr family transcriptional regulator [Aneurinibacillus sp. XH2]MED0680362.1 Crp/Fnr family transcriptional regulator [Aneurinibacillus thermoaerophilus]MED0763282.1 Crp/Fnr family transcriptional regulator [Aneurinibacillus thermoaerophilus]QYY43962.1 Crp/Fnr family transcriptional regulator [Aneurinibacillus thermoaerophilus]